MLLRVDKHKLGVLSEIVGYMCVRERERDTSAIRRAVVVVFAVVGEMKDE